jgi:hypothetical protein
MDFGLAKIQTSASISRSTKTEHIGGTLYYLSPEQVEGKPVDQRSDIYALGMTCYEVLAGYMPLKEKKTTIEILNAIRRDHFPSPTKFNAAVPKELSKIVRKAIEAKPGRRFQSAREMLAEVEKFETEQKKDEDPAIKKRRRVRLVLEIAWGIITVALALTLITIFLVPDLPLRILRWTGIRSSTKVTIQTVPAGAEIKFKGKAAGKSPLRSRLVDVDTLRVSIEESTYFSIDTSIVVKGVTDTTLVLVLQPAAIFAIAVAPESAEVMIDGKIIPPAERGQIELAVGEHDLHIASEGYEAITEKIFLRHGLNPPRLDTLRRKMIAAVLTSASKVRQTKPATEATMEKPVITASTPSGSVTTPTPRGILKLTINPPSDVYIGDSLAAKAATQPSFTLPLGTYAIKVVHATLGNWLEDISMTEQGASAKIDFTKKYMIRVLAFDLNGETLGADIYLDGQPAGQLTPYKLPLNFGHHAIEVRLEGHENQRKEINVEKDDELVFTLKRSR